MPFSKQLILLATLSMAFFLVVSCGGSKRVVKASGADGLRKPAPKTIKVANNQRPEDPVLADNVELWNDAKIASRVIEEARRWIGVPYRYGGSDKSGVDCSGLTMRVFEKAGGLKLPRNSGAQMEYTLALDRKHLQPGDLVFFSSKVGGSKVSHVGLYVGDSKMIHASSSRGVMESSIDEKYFATHYHSSGRVKGLTYSATGRKPPRKSSKRATERPDRTANPETRSVVVAAGKPTAGREKTASITIEEYRAFVMKQNASDSVPDTVYVVNERIIPAAAVDSVLSERKMLRPDSIANPGTDAPAVVKTPPIKSEPAPDNKASLEVKKAFRKTFKANE